MTDFENSGFARLNIAERVASIEASNKHTKETLTEISKSLKEVVKTQNILASQKEELTKLVKVVSDVQQSMRMISDEALKYRFQMERMERDFNEQKESLSEVRETANKNKAHLGLIIKVGTAILIPLIVAVAQQFLHIF